MMIYLRESLRGSTKLDLRFAYACVLVNDFFSGRSHAYFQLFSGRLRLYFQKCFWNILRAVPSFSNLKIRTQRQSFLALTQLVFELLHTIFQLLDFLTGMRQPTDVCVKTLVLAERLDWNAPPDTGAYDLTREYAGF